MKIFLNIKNKNKIVETDNSTLLSDAVENAGIMLDLQCGGLGTCGKCKVVLEKGTFLVKGKEIEIKEPVAALSCKTYIVSENAIISIPESTLLKHTGQISSLFSFPEIASNNKKLGLGIDIGTTTVVVILIDRSSGKVLGNVSCFNQQMARGEDISSRISFSTTETNGLKFLQDLVIHSTINVLIDEILQKQNVNQMDIVDVAVSANTVMSHIFSNISPETIGQHPFTPEVHRYEIAQAKDLGLKVNPDAEVYIIPSVSGYLGGDVISDLFISELNEKEKSAANSLMIDLGTNSEMVFLDNNNLFATSAAAGPTFEGAGLLFGCRGIAGAIEHINISNELEFDIKTIENKGAIGICGSGIIDFVASAYERELINNMGRYDTEKLKSIGRFREVDYNGNKIIACHLLENILVTELDIEQVLKAKAAIYAGIKILINRRDKKLNDINKIILSGGFAKYINIQNAITIGMLPNIEIEKYSSIGNGSLGGAYYAIQTPGTRKQYEDFISEPIVINLNEDDFFEFEFIDALAIP